MVLEQHNASTWTPNNDSLCYVSAGPQTMIPCVMNSMTHFQLSQEPEQEPIQSKHYVGNFAFCFVCIMFFLFHSAAHTQAAICCCTTQAAMKTFRLAEDYAGLGTGAMIFKRSLKMALKRFSREKVTPAATLVISRAPVKKAIFSERLQI